MVTEWRVPEGALTGSDELSLYFYHLRSRRAAASFARCWLLVKGETFEYWLMSELITRVRLRSRERGRGLCRVRSVRIERHAPRLPRHLGIEWHLLVDGDMAGQR